MLSGLQLGCSSCGAVEQRLVDEALRRYYYYVHMGLPACQLAPFRQEWWARALALVPGGPPPAVSQVRGPAIMRLQPGPQECLRWRGMDWAAHAQYGVHLRAALFIRTICDRCSRRARKLAPIEQHSPNALPALVT